MNQLLLLTPFGIMCHCGFKKSGKVSSALRAALVVSR